MREKIKKLSKRGEARDGSINFFSCSFSLFSKIGAIESL
jgi:hypothetical protein